MARPRGKNFDLAKALDAAGVVAYVVAADGVLVYCSRRCAEWLGCPASVLVGLRGSYHSPAPSASNEAFDVTPMIAALAPPPDSMSGAERTARVVPPPPAVDRWFRYVPLTNDSGGVALIVAFETTADRPTESAEPAAVDWHALLAEHRRRLAADYHVDHLVGRSAAIERVRTQVALARRHRASVLIVGVEGSDRGRMARAIHYVTGDAQRALVPLACDVLTVDLLRATLRALGRGAAASAGTLLLESVDQLASDAQLELEHALADARIAWRLIATCRARVDRLPPADFRGELGLALSAQVIELPALAERATDIPLIAQHQLEEVNARSKKQLGGFTREALDRLAAYPWPGDLRELAEAVHAAHAAAEPPLVTLADLPARVRAVWNEGARRKQVAESIRLDAFLADVERELLTRALRRARGNKTKAARLLGLSRPRLYRRLVQLGLEPPDGATSG